MRRDSREFQIKRDCSSRHRNCHLNYPRRHRFGLEEGTPELRAKRCALLMFLMKRCVCCTVEVLLSFYLEQLALLRLNLG